MRKEGKRKKESVLIERKKGGVKKGPISEKQKQKNGKRGGRKIYRGERREKERKLRGGREEGGRRGRVLGEREEKVFKGKKKKGTCRKTSIIGKRKGQKREEGGKGGVSLFKREKRNGMPIHSQGLGKEETGKQEWKKRYQQ